MPTLKRTSRTVIATGGGSTPCLERLGNGDLLVSYRRYRPEWGVPGLGGWNGEVKRSRDGGRTWGEPILNIKPKLEDDPSGFLPYHGMALLPDGTILLPCRGGDGGVFLLRSEDNGESWTGPDRIGEKLDGVDDWHGIQPYGKIRLLSDGDVIMPVWGRFRGSRYGITGHMRSSNGGKTWSKLVVIARGLLGYNETIQLPDGRLLAVVQNDRSPTDPFYWSWSEDIGRTWSDLEVTSSPVYGQSPSLFMTKKGQLVCGYRWVGDLDVGFVGVALSYYNAEDGWNGVFDRAMQIVWLGGAIKPVTGGAKFAGYPSFAYVDDESILCAYFMSWAGGGDPTTTDIEGVYFTETD